MWSRRGGGSGSTNYRELPRWLLSIKSSADLLSISAYLIDPITAITDYVKTANPDAFVKSSLLDYDLSAAASLAQTVEKCLVFVTAFSQEGTDRSNISIYHKFVYCLLQGPSSC